MVDLFVPQRDRASYSIKSSDFDTRHFPDLKPRHRRRDHCCHHRPFGWVLGLGSCLQGRNQSPQDFAIVLGVLRSLDIFPEKTLHCMLCDAHGDRPGCCREHRFVGARASPQCHFVRLLLFKDIPFGYTRSYRVPPVQFLEPKRERP